MDLIINLGREVDRVDGSRRQLQCSELAEPHHAIMSTASHQRFNRGSPFTIGGHQGCRMQDVDVNAPPPKTAGL